MATLFAFLLPFVGLVAAVLGVVVTLVSATLSGLLGALIWIATVLLATGNVLMALAMNKRLAAGLTIGLALSVAVGPPLVSNIDLALTPIDILAEGPVRYGFEVLSKAGFVQIKGAYEAIAPIYNKIVEYLFDRFDVYFLDFKDLYGMIVATGDYFRVLEFVRDTWEFLASFLLYFPDIKAPGGKVEFFNEINPGGHFFPFTDIATPSVYYKYAHNPRYGSFPKVDYSGPLYYLLNFFEDFIDIFKAAGDIVANKVAQLAFPAQLFFPSFILRLDAEASTWRELADLFTRIISFVAGESFYPKLSSVAARDAQSVQPKRFKRESYIARVFRIIGQIIRLIFLLINDATTIRRPKPLNAVTSVIGIEFIKDKLIGAPGIDLFLDPDLTALLNVNLLSKHFFSCFAAKEVYDTDPSARPLIADCLTFNGIFKRTLPINAVDPAGCSRTCCLWSGLTTPREDERIDYLGEAYEIVPAIAQMIEDPSGVSTLARQEAILLYNEVLRSIMRIIFSAIFYIQSNLPGYNLCVPPLAAFTFANEANEMAIRILQYFYRPRTCLFGSPHFRVEPLTCFITINSRASGAGFWKLLCDIMNVLFHIDDFGLGDDTFTCTGAGKRNVASDRFAGPPPTLTFRDKLHVYAMRWASETRKAMTAVDTCVFAPNSTASTGACATDVCSVGPCASTVFDCIYEALPEKNLWRNVLRPNKDTGIAIRNFVNVALAFVDLVRGCSDSLLMRTYNSMRDTVSLVRSFFARWTLVVGDFVPTYFQCMVELRNANHTDAEQDNNRFAECIGLKKKPAQQRQQQRQNTTEWQETLEHNGVYRNASWCSFRLHKIGVVVDDVGISESLSLDHLVTRFCLFQLSYGTRANLAGVSSAPLPEYLDGWLAAQALSSSTDLLDDEKIATMKLPHEMPEPIDALPIEPLNSTESRTTGTAHVQAFVAALQELMPAAEMAAAMLNYYADLNDLVATQPSSAAEKAELDHRLLLHHVGLAHEARRKRREMRPNEEVGVERARESPLYAESEERKRNFVNAANSLDSRITALQEFGRQMYWAGTYPIATARTEQEDVPFEFSVDLRSHFGGEPTLSMRVKHTDEYGVVDDSPEQQTLWQTVEMQDFESLLTDMSAEADASPAQLQLIDSAMTAYRNMRGAMVPRFGYVRGASTTRSGRAALSYASTMISLVWRIVNRRLRVEGLPAFHSASMLLEMLGGREKSIAQLPDWLSGRVSYLRGAGFVSNEVYARYMAHEQSERVRASMAYLPSRYGEARDVSLMSATRAKAMAVQMELEHEQSLKVLGYESASSQQAFYETQQRSVTANVLKRFVTFQTRAAFLVRHNMHVDDDALHVVAPHYWPLHKELQVVAASNSTSSSGWRARYNIAASLEGGDFLAALDEFLELFGASPNTLQAAQLQLELASNAAFSPLTSPSFFTALKVKFANYVAARACVSPDDYALSGTGVYKFLCFPRVNERALGWYEYFPLRRNYGIFGYFQDSGEIHWPPAMVAVPCLVPRNPIAQCPPPQPLFYQNPTTINYQPGASETGPGGSVPVYPIDTSSVLGNICITDYCGVVPGNPRRPLCPVFDWCQRNYFPPVVFGFSSGVENLYVWTNDALLLYQNAISSDPATLELRFYSFGLLFLLIAFAEFFFLPIPFFFVSGAAPAYFIVLGFLASEFFVLLRPELYAYVLIFLWVVHEVAPLVAWLLWAPLVLHLGLLLYVGSSFIGATLFAVFPYLLPLNLLLKLSTWLGGVPALDPYLALLSPIGVTLSSARFATLSATMTSKFATFGATELNNVMAIFSFWNVELLLFETAGVSYLAVIFGGAAFMFLLSFFSAFAIFPALLAAIVSFLTAFGAANVASQVDDLEDTTHKQIGRLRNIASLVYNAQQQQVVELRGQIEQLRKLGSAKK